MSMDESTLQSKGRDLVAQEVHLCLSSMVHILAGQYGEKFNGSDFCDLTEQAYELSSPIPDYEEAAREVGWTTSDSGQQFVNEKDVDEDTGQCRAFEPSSGNVNDAGAWQELCEEESIEPYDREVYEHWAVSSWLADKLEARGEKVDRDFAGLIVWARTTTGQAILLDGVIRDIVRELHALQAEG